MVRRWTKSVMAVSGRIAGSAAAAGAIGSLLWDRSTARAVGRLVTGGSASRPEVFSLEQLAGLPRPVLRYFEFALTAGQPCIRSVRAKQTGEFRNGGLDAP